MELLSTYFWPDASVLISSLWCITLLRQNNTFIAQYKPPVFIYMCIWWQNVNVKPVKLNFVQKHKVVESQIPITLLLITFKKIKKKKKLNLIDHLLHFSFFSLINFLKLSLPQTVWPRRMKLRCTDFALRYFRLFDYKLEFDLWVASGDTDLILTPDVQH